VFAEPLKDDCTQEHMVLVEEYPNHEWRCRSGEFFVHLFSAQIQVKCFFSSASTLIHRGISTSVPDSGLRFFFLNITSIHFPFLTKLNHPNSLAVYFIERNASASKSAISNSISLFISGPTCRVRVKALYNFVTSKTIN